MTDLTAAQPPFLTGVPEEWVSSGMSNDDLVEEAFSAGMNWQEHHDATLIEQQAEQIAIADRDAETRRAQAERIRKERDDFYAKWQQAESEVAALRKAIKDAPHGGRCNPLSRQGTDCDCWKSRVAHGD